MKNGLETQMAVIAVKIGAIETKVTSIESKLEGHYVTKEEFDPVKRLVYGMVTLMLTAVIVALLALVVKK
jgi:hypothetical protein